MFNDAILAADKGVIRLVVVLDYSAAFVTAMLIQFCD